jgi:chemotaxis protein CheC
MIPGEKCMTETQEIKLKDEEKDALKEVGNMGIGHAATALSKMINKKIDISLPNIRIIRTNQAFDRYENEILASEMEITGDLEGTSIMLFPKQTGLQLIDKLYMRAPGETKTVDEDAKSAFNETANVIGGAYLNSLARFLSIKLFPKPPIFYEGTVKDLRANLENTDFFSIVSIDTELKTDAEEINGSFLLIFSEESLGKLLESLKKTVGG